MGKAYRRARRFADRASLRSLIARFFYDLGNVGAAESPRIGGNYSGETASPRGIAILFPPTSIADSLGADRERSNEDRLAAIWRPRGVRDCYGNVNAFLGDRTAR